MINKKLRSTFYACIVMFLATQTPSSGANGLSSPGPRVQIKRYFPNTDPKLSTEYTPTEQELRWAAGLDRDTSPVPNLVPGKFPRLLDYSEEKIKNYILNGGDFPAHESNKEMNMDNYSFIKSEKNNYMLLFVKFSGYTGYSYKTSYRPMAVYLLKHNQSIGYALMDYLPITAKQPFPALTQILNGRKNESFSNKINHQGHKLRKEARLTKKTEFEFAVFDIQPKHSDYIERYSLVVDSKAKDYFKKLPYEIALDAFYPEKYEKEMEEQILQWLPTLAYTFGD